MPDPQTPVHTPKRILLIASTTGYQTRMFVDAARQLGFNLVLATDRCHVLDDPWVDQAIPIRFENPASSVDALANCGKLDGIVALGDRPALIAAEAAGRLGIVYNSPESVRACGDKFLARECFRAANLLVPAYRRVALNENPEAAAAGASFPCVLKPLHLSASRGVIRADSPEEFVAAFRRIQAILNQPDLLRARDSEDGYLLVEQFIPGREFALDGIVTGAELHVLAIFDKPDPLDGPYFEETIYVTPSRSPAEIQNAIRQTAAETIRALGLKQGPVHAEMRVNNEGVWMLEVAARPIGGLCARVLPGLPELILRHAAGEDVSDAGLLERAAGVMMIPIPDAGIYQDVLGVEEAKAVAGIEEVVITAKQGQQLVPLPEGNSYLGFIFARADSPAEVEQSLRLAHTCLRFEILAALPVLSR